MGQLELRTVTRTQGNNAALKSGEISPSTCRLVFEEVPVLVQAFRRMVRTLEFDVCEMAFTTYLCAKAHGTPFTALPIFLVRGFHHGAVLVRADAPMRPGDLHGRRVGVNRGYTVTTGVWARAILQEEHGLDLSSVTWAPSGDEHVEAYEPPANVAPLAPGSDLGDLLVSGELAAVVGAEIDRPEVMPLIADPERAALTALTERGFYPINHVIVVRDELLTAHPDLAADLFAAFASAKRRYVDRLRAGALAEPSTTDRLYARVLEATGDDPLPYGVDPNRKMIEALMAHAVTQQILSAPPGLADVFAAGTLDLTA